MGPSPKRNVLSFIVTLAAVLMLVFAAPVRAVQLNLSAPDTADEGDIVGFDLGLDIESGERVPFESITLQIDGPEPRTCIFELDGTPISGCEEFVIFQTSNFADYGYGYGYGEGYDGTSTYGTDFGYGYGYGYGPAGPNELFWRVEWDTAGITPGEYTVTYYATADGRTFNLEDAHTLTITGDSLPPGTPGVNLYVKEGFPQDNNYVFVCESVGGFDPVMYDWEYGDGHVLYDIENDNTYHTYTASGEYIVSCGGTDADGNTHYDSISVTVGEEADGFGLRIEDWYPQGNEYSFICDTNGEASTYDWEIRHLETGIKEYLQYDIMNEAIYHIFQRNGEYLVSCGATYPDGHTMIDWMFVTLSGVPEAPAAAPSEADNSNSTIQVLMTESSTTVVIPPGANSNLHIDVMPGIDDIKIDLSALLQNNGIESSAFIPMYLTFNVNTTQGYVNVIIPAGITIYSTPAWDGIVTLPQLTAPPAGLEGVTTSIDIGADEPLWFNKAVRMAIEGEAGTNAAYVQNGTVVNITTACVNDINTEIDIQLSGDECTIDVGSDLVIYTEHFTQFVTYTDAQPPSQNSGSSGGSSSSRRRAVSEPENRPPVFESVNDQPIEQPEIPAEEPVAEEPVAAAPEQSFDPPAVTGQVTGSGYAIPGWMKALGAAALVLVVAAAVVARVRKH